MLLPSSKGYDRVNSLNSDDSGLCSEGIRSELRNGRRLSWLRFSSVALDKFHDSESKQATASPSQLIYIPTYLSLSPAAPSLEHRASVKRFVSLQFLNPKTGLLGRGISPSQGRYLHKDRINADIYALSLIGTHDPSVRASEDSSCLRHRGHCDQLTNIPFDGNQRYWQRR
jgi:hypothetical protein